MSDYPELRKLQDIIDQQADRILDLEAALRTIRFEIDSQCGPLTVDTIDPANPLPGDPPIQQQPNDAVYPGFRGNNEA